MGEEETDILASICGLHRHQNAAQTVQSKSIGADLIDKAPNTWTG